jgi:type III pantothenate kinase
MRFSGNQPFRDSLLLVVEAGNSTTSLVVFEGDEILENVKHSSKTLSNADALQGELTSIIEKYPTLDNAVICSVVPALEELAVDCLRRHLAGQVLTIAASLSLPFTLHYDSPASFGADRLALCALSQQLYPDDAVIALDIGTAITVDVLSSRNCYLGGLIMPGVDLMAKALHQHTAQLPLVALERPKTLLAHSTVGSISNGILHGCAATLDGLVSKIRRWLGEEHGEAIAQVLVTGGNAALLAGMLECASQLDELAVVKGARYLFSLNAALPESCTTP